jgi:hypothetical protein
MQSIQHYGCPLQSHGKPRLLLASIDLNTFKQCSRVTIGFGPHAVDCVEHHELCAAPCLVCLYVVLVSLAYTDDNARSSGIKCSCLHMRKNFRVSHIRSVHCKYLSKS